MYDLVIRGGTIVDGSGADRVTGDIAIDGDRIAAVGGKLGPARREIAADGLLVTPGWIDAHTHYDGQATWDQMLAPSCWHGVSTVLFGNCGVGFAPVQPDYRDGLIALMEGVEEIPGITLSEGLKWDWKTFPDYLDALDRLPRAINVAAQVPHHPLRVFVMGERAIRREPATECDIAEMRRLTEEALRAGAFGFTTSRTEQHKSSDGSILPARNAEIAELLGIGAALGAVGGGAFGMINDFEHEAEDFEWMTRLAKESGRPVWFLLGDRPTDPQRWRRLRQAVREARSKGARLSGQVAGRPSGLLLGLDTHLNPFSIRPSYEPLMQLPLAERIARLRDPAVRRTILADTPSPQQLARHNPLRREVARRWDRIFVMGNPPDYEPPASASIAVMAEQQGRRPDEVAYDYYMEHPDQFLFFPLTGYVEGNHDIIRELLLDPHNLLGLSDAGAHCTSIVDASLPSYMLTHWARDRHRGEQLPLEFVVKLQTSDPAAFFGFADRGRLAPGLKADINIIDLDRLSLHVPEFIHDLPASRRRLVQRVDGYAATLVSGNVVFDHGEHTGALPGRLVRARY